MIVYLISSLKASAGYRISCHAASFFGDFCISSSLQCNINQKIQEELRKSKKKGRNRWATGKNNYPKRSIRRRPANRTPSNKRFASHWVFEPRWRKIQCSWTPASGSSLSNCPTNSFLKRHQKGFVLALQITWVFSLSLNRPTKNSRKQKQHLLLADQKQRKSKAKRRRDLSPEESHLWSSQE